MSERAGSESAGSFGAAAAMHPGVAVGRLKTLGGGAIGHFIEWYDWSIYGFLAGIFAGQMFPAADPTATFSIAKCCVCRSGSDSHSSFAASKAERATRRRKC